jgi:twitching motility protein PilT
MADANIKSIISNIVKWNNWVTDIYLKWDDKVTIRAHDELWYNFLIGDNESIIKISNIILKDFLVENLYRYKLKYDDFLNQKYFNFRYTLANYNFRVNSSISKWKLLLIFRIVNSKVIDLKDLWINLHYLKWILNENQWLFLVSWPTWSWKSTTLSSIVNYYNQNYNKHIITLEDPIEQIYTDNKSVVHQFELWDDFNSFELWMENILRQDPDVIVIWEIRSKETLDIALRLAETWHLVFWTIHWKWANWVIWKIIRMYENEKLISWMLADVLIWILYQQKFVLENKSTVVCLETLYNTDEVRAWFIQWKYSDFKSNMQTSNEQHMTTMSQYLENYINPTYKLSWDEYKSIQSKINSL